MTQAPTDPGGRKLLRLEVRNAETPIERKPEWIKTRARMGPEYTALKSLVKSEGLHTVCQEAGCPNIYECWEDREATFLIGGDQCTRRCDFCQIDTGKPQPLDRDEPRRVAESVQKMELRYATITGVARDDLPDGGAWLYAETVRAIHELNPGTGVENLIPDFNGKPDLLAEVFESRPEVLAHNVETVPRIFKRIRPAFRYDRSLDVLTAAARLRAGHQVQPDPRHGRDPRGGQPGAASTCTRPAASWSRSPSTSAPRRATTRSSAGSSPRSSSSWPPRPRRSASPASCPARSCVRRTGPVGCTVRPCRPVRRPDHQPATTDHGVAPVMAKSPTPAEPDKLSRRQQFAQTYQMAKKSDPADRRLGGGRRPARRPSSGSACSSWSPDAAARSASGCRSSAG